MKSSPKAINIKFTETHCANQIKNLKKALKYLFSLNVAEPSQFYMYICNKYISFVNDFTVSRHYYHPVIFTFYETQFSFIKGSQNDFPQQYESQGYLYQLQIQEIFLFLYKIQALQLTLCLPWLKQPFIFERQQSQILIYGFGPEGTQFDLKSYTKLINKSNGWPFHKGLIDQQCSLFNKKQIIDLFPISHNLMKNIQYSCQYVDIWLHIQPDGIYLKHKKDGRVIIEHKLKSHDQAQFIDYNQLLNGQNCLLIKTKELFHHLKSHCKNHQQTQLCLIQQYDQSAQKLYVLLKSGEDSKYHVNECFRAYKTQKIQQNNMIIRTKMALASQTKSIFRDKKTVSETKIELNKYRCPDYEQNANLQIAVYNGQLSISTISSNTQKMSVKSIVSKYSINLD